MPFQVFFVLGIPLDAISRPREDIASAIDQNDQIALLRQVKMNAIVVRPTRLRPNQDLGIRLMLNYRARPSDPFTATEVRRSLLLDGAL
jgi:hypothetical protein